MKVLTGDTKIPISEWVKIICEEVQYQEDKWDLRVRGRTDAPKRVTKVPEVRIEELMYGK